MSKEYDQITAFHYAAYRPPLHSQILDEHFGNIEKCQRGLDVGCGTGQSSIALSAYCEKVIGLEPSQEMLDRALTHPSIEYALYNLKYFDFADNSFDITTFAGSLFYAKSQQILDEVIRTSKHSAEIVVYDFEIVLDEVLHLLQTNSVKNQKSEYNHRVNFSGLNQENIKFESTVKNSVCIEISTSDLTHLLLSSKDTYHILLESFGDTELYGKVADKLAAALKSEKTNIEAFTYLTDYTITK